MTDIDFTRLAELRREAAAIVSQISTGFLPNPDRINDRDSQLPGPVWLPGRCPRCVRSATPGRRECCDWSIHAVVGETDVVFIHHPGDLDGDVTPFKLAAGRELAMCILAACDWADRQEPTPVDIPQLAAIRDRRARRLRRTTGDNPA